MYFYKDFTIKKEKDIMRLIQNELKRFLNKRDSLIIMGILAITPAILSVCFRLELGGISLTGQMSMLEYMLMIWSFLKYVFILYIIPIYLPCNFIAKEIEHRSVQILLMHEAKSKILISKLAALVIEISVFMCLFFTVTAGSYQFIIRGTAYEAVGMVTSYTAGKTFILFGFQWLEMIFLLCLSVLFSIILKGNTVLVATLGFVAIEKIFENVDSLKSYLPLYIADFANLQDKLGQGNAYVLQSLLVYGALLTILLTSSIYVWNKREY